MATMTATATQQAIDDKIGTLLDQLEFQKRLKISLAEADRGEYKPAEDVFAEIDKELKNGVYG
jgi:predicted transcriptional regulator